jgi:hypothetical protein
VTITIGGMIPIRASATSPACLAFCLAAAILTLSTAMPSYAEGQIRLFKATDSRELYTKQPGAYEPLPVEPQPGVRRIYIEKAPFVTLSLDDILALVVDKQPVVPDLESALDYLRNRRAWEETRGEHVVTIYLTKRAARPTFELLNKSSGQLIAIRVGDQTLSVSRLVGGFSGQQWTLLLSERNEDRLKNILSPLASKVVWK